jgi:hypothetical protein
MDGVVGTGLLCDVSTLCVLVPPPGLYGVVGTGLLWDVSTPCAVVPPPGLYGVVDTGLLYDVSTVCCSTSSWTIWGVVFPSELCSCWWSSLNDGSHASPRLSQIELEVSPSLSSEATALMHRLALSC